MYEDKTLKCRDCGKEFIFTASEQEFYAEKGFQHAPSRCPECRAARKAAMSERSEITAERPVYTIICAKCGKTDTVNFEPRGNGPVYCRACYRELHPKH